MSGPVDDLMPPHNIEAELCVLGSVLLDADSLDEMAPVVDPEDFFRDSHGEVYRAMRDLHRSGRPVDAISVIDELTRRGSFERVGGHETIRTAVQTTPSSANARYYAQIVREKAVGRGLAEYARSLLRAAHSNRHSADDLLARADRGLAAVADGRISRDPRSLADAARDSLRRFDKRALGETTGVYSGLDLLDNMTNGFRPAQLIVLGARPGQGKTSLALNIAESVAHLHGEPVLFFSLEMGLGELGDRTVCSRSETESDDYRKATETARRRRALLERKVAELEGFPVYIDDTPDATPSQMTAIARRMKRKMGLGMVIVDYLQIAGADEKRDSEFDRVTKAAKAMKSLSKVVDAPVLALSQLSRKCEERTDKRPMMSDLRSTGQIEQDADLILFLYRHETYARGEKPGIAEINVAKQRDGATGTVEVHFDKKLTRFSNLIPDFGPAPVGSY